MDNLQTTQKIDKTSESWGFCYSARQEQTDKFCKGDLKYNIEVKKYLIFIVLDWMKIYKSYPGTSH